MNKGFVTEQTHYEVLSEIFDFVTPPKGSGVGSDFLVTVDGQVATFESKTSNTDIFDFGVINLFANGFIHSTSSFMSNNQVEQLQGIVLDNLDAIQQYAAMANTFVIPHMTTKEAYDEIKAAKKLVHVKCDPVDAMIESSMLKTTNIFAKANYIVIGERIYLSSDNEDMDPLGLREHGAPVLANEHIDYMTIRTARGGAKDSGRCSVSLRPQFRLKRKLPPTNVRLR